MDTVAFARTGFHGPSRVLSAEECRGLLGELALLPAPLDWAKGHAATSTRLALLSRRPAILDPVRAALGPSVLLWGASLVTSPPGHLHPHHVDIETALPESRAVSVWIGLEGTSRESGLRLVAGSHRYGEPIQQVAHQHRARRAEYGEDRVLAWAAERDPDAAIVTLEVADGEAVWFHGGLWHGSHNTTHFPRRALLLQYAAADTPIRVPDFGDFEWPFRFHDAPRPPCLVVAGESGDDTNRVVPLPVRAGARDPVLTTWAREIPSPLPDDPDTGFRPHQQFRGATGHLDFINCHVSTLSPEVSPHPPHVHEEEEVLLMLSGEAEITVDDARGRRITRLTAGGVGYYPAGRAHTLRAVGDRPAEYLMLKWMAPAGFPAELDGAVHPGPVAVGGGDGGWRATVRFAGATTYLSRLQCHDTVMDPGAGYPAHADAHDLAVVLLSGTVETLGVKLTAPAVAFTSAGVAHGLANTGLVPARYVVFEFEGREQSMVPAGAPSASAGPSRMRRMHAAMWGAGGSLLRRTPRLHRAMRRGLRWLSPWH